MVVMVERGAEAAVLAMAVARLRVRKAMYEGNNAIASGADLQQFITRVTGHRIPTVRCCPDHDAPFDFVEDFYFERVTEGIVLANRGGGKTEDIAALHLANGYGKPGYSTFHLGAIDTQASRCYDYYKAGLRSEPLRGMAPDPHIRETLWENGSKIEIRPATEAQTQSWHGPLTSFDEVEQGKYQPWENAKGLPHEWRDASGKIHPAQFLAASTRQSGLGLMQKALDDAAAKSWRVYTWCVVETIDGSTCHDEDGQPMCEGCPIFDHGCEGRALQADGFRSRTEIVRAFNRVGADTWEAQYLCRKPDAKSLIYANFSKANITEDAAYKPEGGPIYVSYDWGYTDPAHIGLVQYREGAFHVFDELVGSGRSERDWVQELVRRVLALPDYKGPTLEQWADIWSGKQPWPKPWPAVWPEIAAGDPSAVQLRHELKEHGIGAASAGAIRHEVPAGQDVLRAAISTAGDLRRLFIHPTCKETIRNLENYRARELADGSFDPRPDPDPANHAFSHGCDSLRYLMWRMRRTLGLAQEGSDDDAAG